MKKKLGLLASLMFLSATALFWTGCSGSSRYAEECCDQPSREICAEPCKPCPPPCKPVCPEPCKPVCKPVCPPRCEPVCEKPCPAPSKPVCPAPCAPVCKPVCEQPCAPKCVALKPCKYGPQGECSCYGVTVRAKNPSMCMLGDQYPLDLEVTACIDVCEASVSTTLPEGVSYIRSQPEAKVEGRTLTWQFGHLSKGQMVPVKVMLKCEREGDLCTCFCVKATPVAFCALMCAKPVLTCEKTAPAQVCPGDPIHYTITVTNIGSCTAEKVVVTDTLPDGVEYANCQKTLTFDLGNLEPCQSKKVEFCVTAVKRGKVCNTAIVTACNANQTSCEACTCICCCAIECKKVGPKEVSVGQNADYTITVTNTGDLPLHDVIITDMAPTATSIVKAEGANVRGKQAVWKLKEMRPGEQVNFNITLTTCTPGFFVNSATVTNCEGCNSCCEFGTKWKGRPALEACVDIPENPICVGETTRLRISVQNKGQEYDSNVNVVVNLPAGISVVEASGATKAHVDGQTVSFDPVQSLAPRQKLDYNVTIKANGRGDFRPKIQVSSDFIKHPITEEESLIVN